MVQTFALDSRLPVPDGMSDSDPNHPANVMRNAQIVQNQAVADTKYDPYPPPRLTKEESERKEKEARAEELRRRPVKEGFYSSGKNNGGIPMVATMFGLIFLAVFFWSQGKGQGLLKGRARPLAVLAILGVGGLVAHRLFRGSA